MLGVTPSAQAAPAIRAAQAAPAQTGDASCPATPFTAIPFCRKATLGATELFPPQVGGSAHKLTAYRLFRPDFPLEVNPDVGQRKWPLVNSFGTTFAWVRQQWDPRLREVNRSRAWILYEADGRREIDRVTVPTPKARANPFAPYLAIQGYACMVDPAKRGYPMVALTPGLFGRRGKYVAARGFISPDALPDAPGALVSPARPEYLNSNTYGPPTRGRTWQQVLIDQGTATGCTQRDLGFGEPAVPAGGTTSSDAGQDVQNLLNPAFPWYYHYNGNFPLRPGARPRRSRRRDVRTVARDPLGNRYSNYNGWPMPNVGTPASPFGTARQRQRFVGGVDPRRVRQSFVEATTTGVDGGGIVRAVVPVNTPYAIADQFGYADPNGYCTPESSHRLDRPARVAQWVLIRLSGGLEGWVPRRIPNRRYDARGCNGG